MKRIFLLALAIIASLGLFAQDPVNLAYFPFTSIDSAPNTQTIIQAEAGLLMANATLYMDGSNGSSSYDPATELNRFSGNAVNLMEGFANSYDLAIRNTTANGKSVVFKISTEGFQDLMISYAYRRTKTGYYQCVWSYSVNGTDFIDAATKTYDPENAISPSILETVDLSGISALDDQEAVYLKLTLSGCSSASGNNRFDNVQFNANPAGPDIYPPRILSASADDSSTVAIVFNEELDEISATDVDNYTIDGDYEITDAELTGNIVTLTVAPALADGSVCNIIVENIEDLFGNVMLPDTVTVEYGINPEFQCNNIAELRTKLDFSDYSARVVDNVEYRLNNSVIITAKAAYKNQKVIQDETGAILIFDENNVLDPNNNLEVGDKISGLYGTLTNYYGFLEFVPTRTYESFDGFMQTVEPMVITLSQLNDVNFMSAHQSELITLEDACITSTGIFSKLTRYDVAQAGVTAPALFPYFQDVDYLSQAIPTNVSQQITGTNFSTTKIGSNNYEFRYYIVPRSSNDMTALTGILDFGEQHISVYPNPTTDFVNINVDNANRIEIYDMNGRQVASQSIANNGTISMLNFANGAYILRVLNDNMVLGSTKIIKR
ncbi:MAG: T9SS type A sorting domain-containing protein [Bacteroidales bacterium]|nr:T9SS type A sorting domain-containing protein [Bacteroidales bacterium]